jgi:hypothetical protein
MNRSQYVILGNATSPPRLLEVTRITNSTSGYDDDQVELRDVLDSTLTYATITAEGRGNITIGGLSYQLEYRGASTISEQARQVRLLPPYTPRTYEGCSFPPSAPSATCTDSDATPQYPDGKNYNVMGTTRGPDGNVANAVYTDTCTSSVLREFFCQNGAVSSAAGTFTSYIGSSDYTCPYGCSSGACLPAPPATGSGVYVDSTSDKAGSWGVFSANNKLDHHFRISLSTSLPHTKTLRYATLVHTVYGEAWSTLNTAPNPYTPNMYPLVLTNGTTQLITANGQQIPLAIGSTSAPLVLELYAEKAAAFAGGTLTLNFTDGTQTSLTIAKPTQSTTSSPGSRFQVTCQGPPQRRCRWFSCRNVYPSPFQTACGTATCPAGFTTLVAPQPC